MLIEKRAKCRLGPSMTGALSIAKPWVELKSHVAASTQFPNRLKRRDQ
jgi:hypothetical protein